MQHLDLEEPTDDQHADILGIGAAEAAMTWSTVPVVYCQVFNFKPQRTGGAPAREMPDFRHPRTLFADLAFLFRSPAYMYLLAASTFMGLNVFAASVWTPSFLERVHGMSMGSIASVIGPIRGICGLAGVLMGGVLIDRLTQANLKLARR